MAGTPSSTAKASSSANITPPSPTACSSPRPAYRGSLVCRASLFCGDSLLSISPSLPDLNEQACLPKGGHAFFPFRAGAFVFVHLHCHSHYSFLRGVASPEEIIAAAAEQKMSAVALTDTNGLYAAVPFCQAAKAAGIKPIVGVALDVEWPLNRREIPRLRAPTGSGPSARNDNFKSMPLVLLATDMEGYSNLCQLVTLRHLGTTKLAQNTTAAEIDDRPVTLQELAEHSRGVIALCPLQAISRDASTCRGAACCAPTKAT